jgi:hypothetical protein
LRVIDFTRAFCSAWERMLVILFRPFDFVRWLTIGFSAFLAGLLTGGNGFNGSFNAPTSSNFSPPNQATLQHSAHQAMTALSVLQTGMFAFLALTIFVVGLAISLLMYWLGARGQFLLLDNIVRNRAAIAEPWTRYARQANRVFFFQLLCLAAGMAVMLVLGIPALLTGIFGLAYHAWPKDAAIGVLITLGAVYFAVSLLFFCFIFLFQEWGIPLIFRHDLTLRAAMAETWGIVRRWPGPIALFLLLRVALALAFFVCSVIVCCATCCVAGLPYIGTVVLLPALVYLKCFSLDCLAQLGPEYDIWTVDVPPVPAPELR